MYQWFDDDAPVNPMRESIAGLDYALSQLNSTLNDCIHYYRRAPLVVNNNHPLVRLLNNLPLSLDRDALAYFYGAGAIGIELADSMNFTTVTRYGKVFSPGFFYGPACDEIVIAHDDEFDYDAIDRGDIPWQELSPLKVLSHPFTDLNFHRLNSKYPTQEKGLAIFSLNVSLLAFQFRGWYKDEAQLEDGTVRSVHQFISEYVLTNVWRSHANIALFNRLKAKAFDEEVMPFAQVHSFYMTNAIGALDSALDKLILSLKRRTYTWDEIVYQLPSVEGETFHETIRLPRVASTRQIRWALVVARLSLIDFLVRFTHAQKNNRNQLYVRRLKGFIDGIRTDRLLDRQLPRSVQVAIDDVLYRDIMPLLT